MILAAFDFDGTLTRRDTLLPFLRFSVGIWKTGWSLVRCAPLIAAWKIGLLPGGKVKERLFSLCMKGITLETFQENGVRFAQSHPSLLRPEAIARLRWHLSEGHCIYVVTASMEAWCRPMLGGLEPLHFLATVPETKAGVLTGHFATQNCYGAEKVRRLKEARPYLGEETLYAYGDSPGDKKLLEEADRAFYRTFGSPAEERKRPSFL